MTQWRHNGKVMPWWLTCFHVWNSRHTGRYWKRRLSKARRRAWRDPHGRGLVNVETRCNWKDW